MSFLDLPEQNPKAELLHFLDKYSGFMVINHNPNAVETQDNLREFQGICDSFPPTVDGFIPFCTRAKSLKNFINDADFVISSLHNERVKDYLKNMLRNLGFVVLRCLENDIAMDFNSEHIFVSDNTYPRIRAIAIKGDSPNFASSKANLLALYDEIMKAVYANSNLASTSSATLEDPEIGIFIQKLQECSTVGEVKAVFNCWIFWNMYTRLKVATKLGQLTKVASLNFQLKFKSTVLPGWRLVMSQDSIVENMMKNQKLANKEKPKTSQYDRREVDLLLIFIRVCISHFRQLCPGFTKEVDAIEYLENHFPHIMCEVYKGCEFMNAAHIRKDGEGFNFGFEFWK